MWCGRSGGEKQIKNDYGVGLRASLIKQMIIPVFTSADDLTAINEQAWQGEKKTAPNISHTKCLYAQKGHTSIHVADCITNKNTQPVALLPRLLQSGDWNEVLRHKEDSNATGG